MHETWPFLQGIPQILRSIREILGFPYPINLPPTSVQPYPIPTSSPPSFSRTSPKQISTTHQINLIHAQLPRLALPHMLSSPSPITTRAPSFLELIRYSAVNHDLGCVGAKGEEFLEVVGERGDGGSHAFAKVENLWEEERGVSD